MSARDDAFSRTPRGRYRLLRYHARRLGVELLIDFDTYVELISAGCAYCGFPLAETGRGLDRKEPRGDYSVENVVASCGECNAFKNALFTHEEMLVIGRAVAEVKAARTGPHTYRRGEHARRRNPDDATPE